MEFDLDTRGIIQEDSLQGLLVGGVMSPNMPAHQKAAILRRSYLSAKSPKQDIIGRMLERLFFEQVLQLSHKHLLDQTTKAIEAEPNTEPFGDTYIAATAMQLISLKREHNYVLRGYDRQMGFGRLDFDGTKAANKRSAPALEFEDAA